MALPELIEIVPLAQPVHAEITVPGSKSITNRALILAALANGEVTLQGALWSEDTQVMTEALIKLGFQIKIEEDPAEFCNRTITVRGLGGKIPLAGTAEQPLELFVGNAGTAARFLSAFVCLGDDVYRLSGVPRMHERPQAALFSALRELGYGIEAENGNDKLPVTIFPHGVSGYKRDLQSIAPKYRDVLTGLKKASCKVSITKSSQFASALLLSSKVGGWQVEIVGENADESPYVVMTSKLMEVFPMNGGVFQVEPDASSGSYFLAVPRVADHPEFLEYSERLGAEVRTKLVSSVQVAGWPDSGWQIDEKFFDVYCYPRMPQDMFERMSKASPEERTQMSKDFLNSFPKNTFSRTFDLGDSIMTAIAIAPVADTVMKFTDLGRLRVQECERVVALRTELTKCGVKVVEEGDTLTVYPSKPEELHGAEIETYHDHRMAMCFAVLGLKVPGIKIKNPACVKKTFPNFFQKLAAAPPHGLGVTILDANSGQKLIGDELFAD